MDLSRLLAPQPTGDVVFLGVLLSQWNRIGEPQRQDKKSSLPLQI